jgi:hypothetical protein
LVETLKAARTQGKIFRLSGLRKRPRYLLGTTRILHLFDEGASRNAGSESGVGRGPAMTTSVVERLGSATLRHVEYVGALLSESASRRIEKCPNKRHFTQHGSPQQPIAAHQRVYVLKKVAAIGKLCGHTVPFSLEKRPAQSVLDFTLPEHPQSLRNVSALVKVIDVGYELDGVQSAVGQFLAGRGGGVERDCGSQAPLRLETSVAALGIVRKTR